MANRRMAAFAQAYLQHMLQQRGADAQVGRQMEVASYQDQLRREADIKNDDRTRSTQDYIQQLTDQLTSARAGNESQVKMMSDISGADTLEKLPSPMGVYREQVANAPRRPMKSLYDFTGPQNALAEKRAQLMSDIENRRGLDLMSEDAKQIAQGREQNITRTVIGPGGEAQSIVQRAEDARKDPRQTFPPGYGFQLGTFTAPTYQLGPTGAPVSGTGVFNRSDPTKPAGFIPGAPTAGEDKEMAELEEMALGMDRIVDAVQNKGVGRLLGVTPWAAQSIGKILPKTGPLSALQGAADWATSGPVTDDDRYALADYQGVINNIIQKQSGVAVKDSEMGRTLAAAINIRDNPEVAVPQGGAARDRLMREINNKRARQGLTPISLEQLKRMRTQPSGDPVEALFK